MKQVETTVGNIPQKYIDYLRAKPQIFFDYYKITPSEWLEWLKEHELLNKIVPLEEISHIGVSIPDYEMRVYFHNIEHGVAEQLKRLEIYIKSEVLGGSFQIYKPPSFLILENMGG